MDAVELHRILSPFWGAIHEVPIVWVQDIYSAEGLMIYNVKHALKNYATLEFGNMRILKSKLWMPIGWRNVNKVLVKWALEHGAKWTYDSEGLLDFQGDYIAFAWDVMKEYQWRWCNGELVVLEFRDAVVEIQGDYIKETGVGEFGNGIDKINYEELASVF